MENVNTNLEELFNTLFPTDGLEPEGFCINSRDLHKAMGVKSQYADWIKSRINRYKFKENSEIKNTHGGNRKSVDYLFTLDMAKNLCMIESTDVGASVRDYFIQAEKALRTLEPELTEEIQQKALGYDQFLDSSNTCSAPVGLG